MIRTNIIKCDLKKDEANALNRASGEVYTRAMVTHWRVFRKSDHWLSKYGARGLSDWQAHDEPKLLHSHSIDAAQMGLYKSHDVTRALKKAGIHSRYAHKRKFYRTTVWDTAGIRLRSDHLLLSLARGLDPICVKYKPVGVVKEVRLVFDLKHKRHYWHIVEDDGIVPKPVTSGITVAIDMGEIHPVAITDGKDVCIMACRELRSNSQGRNRQLAQIQSKQAFCKHGSIRSKKLKFAKAKVCAKRDRRQRDMLHKVSRATVDYAVAHNAQTIAIGDVRNVADKTKVNHKNSKENRQKLSNWPHGKLRTYIEQKAQAVGMGVRTKVPEYFTSQECPNCGHRHKCKDRNFVCPKCKYTFPRDGVGSANILSFDLYGVLGQVRPESCMYRHPFITGKRSRVDTAQVAASHFGLQKPMDFSPEECHMNKES